MYCPPSPDTIDTKSLVLWATEEFAGNVFIKYQESGTPLRRFPYVPHVWADLGAVSAANLCTDFGLGNLSARIG